MESTWRQEESIEAGVSDNPSDTSEMSWHHSPSANTRPWPLLFLTLLSSLKSSDIFDSIYNCYNCPISTLHFVFLIMADHNGARGFTDDDVKASLLDESNKPAGMTGKQEDDFADAVAALAEKTVDEREKTANCNKRPGNPFTAIEKSPLTPITSANTMEFSNLSCNPTTVRSLSSNKTKSVDVVSNALISNNEVCTNAMDLMGNIKALDAKAKKAAG